MSENDKQSCQPVATKQSNNENKKVILYIYKSILKVSL